MLSMCFASTVGVFAGDEGEASIEVFEEGVAPEAADAASEITGETGLAMEAADATYVNSGTTLNAIDFNKSSEADPGYCTVSAGSNFTVNMPAGTLIVIHNDSSYYSIKANGKSYDSYSENGGLYYNYYYVWMLYIIDCSFC